jgi:hypothetical protein
MQVHLMCLNRAMAGAWSRPLRYWRSALSRHGLTSMAISYIARTSALTSAGPRLSVRPLSAF